MVKQILAPRAGLENVDGGIKALLNQGTIEGQLHVARAFKLFKNHFVHSAAGFDQGRRQNRQATALLDVPRATKKTFRFEQRLGVDTTRHGTAFSADERIIAAREARAAVGHEADSL